MTLLSWAGRGVWAPALLHIHPSESGAERESEWPKEEEQTRTRLTSWIRQGPSEGWIRQKASTVFPASHMQQKLPLPCTPAANSWPRWPRCLVLLRTSPPPKIQRFQSSQWTTGLQEIKQDDGNEIGGNGVLRTSFFLIFQQHNKRLLPAFWQSTFFFLNTGMNVKLRAQKAQNWVRTYY